MTTHHFEVVVPNASDKTVIARLRLEPASLSREGGVPLDIPEGELEVQRAFIALDPCDAEGPTELDVELQPGVAPRVHVFVDVWGEKGAAALNFIDQRDDEKEPGGVTLAVVKGHEPKPGVVVEARNPCPIDLAADPWWLPAGSETDEPAPPGPIPVGEWVDLLAPIRNPTDERLEDATVYLEHLGQSQARFESTLWNIGPFEAGAVFPTVWRIRGERSMRGVAYASIVVESRDKDAVRLSGRLDFGRGAEPEPTPEPEHDPEIEEDDEKGRKPHPHRRKSSHDDQHHRGYRES